MVMTLLLTQPSFSQVKQLIPKIKTEEKAPATGDEIYSEIPDEYLEEAQGFYEYCEATSKMSAYYDCECLASRFLDKRIEFGEEKSQDAIMLSINKRCADATEAAGYEYSQCVATAAMLPIKYPIEEYCECYANTYAKLFEAYSRGISSRIKVKLRSRATITCKNPELAKRFYPDPPAKPKK